MVQVTDCGEGIVLHRTPPQFNAAVGALPANFESLWAWNAAQRKWYFCSPQLDLPGAHFINAQYAAQNGLLDFATEGATLEPGAGFWVYRP